MLSTAQLVYWVATFVIVAACLAKGERLQKLAVLIVLASFLVSVSVETIMWNGLRIAVVVVDLALAVGLFWLSVGGRRWWLHFASTFAWVNALVHLVALLDVDIWWVAYVVSRWLLSALVLIAPLLGFIEEPHARRYLRWEKERGANGDAWFRAGG